MNTTVSNRLKSLNIYLGNLFEHFDSALFSYLSPFFAGIFFPNQDPVMALILTFAITPLGMLSRPIGSLVFGYIGDTQGKNRALFLSLIGMGIVTVLMGFLPTYKDIGKAAPLLLLTARILQNFFSAGENIGGAICFLECLKTEKEKNFASSIYSTSTVAGILLASTVVTLLYHLHAVEGLWRWIYYFGGVTVFFGSIIRLNFSEPKIPSLPIPRGIKLINQRLRLLWHYRQVVGAIALGGGFSYATYTIVFPLMNGFIPLVSTITESDITKINTILLLLDMLLLPLFGALANRYGRSRMMTMAALTAALSGIPLFHMLEHCNLATVIFVRICVVTCGVWFSATFHSWSQSLVPAEHRYTIISFSYSLGAQLLGGTASSVSLWIYKQTAWTSSASWYWIFLALLTLAFLANNRSERGALVGPLRSQPNL